MYSDFDGIPAAVKSFLRRHRMDADGIDPEEQLDRFLAEMDRVRRGGKGSVKMIPTYIGEFEPPLMPETVAVLDIGGTNVRSCVAALGPHGVEGIDHRISFLTPGIDEELDTASFFRKVVEGVRENLYTDRIGICFSLATIPAKDGDAEMAAGGKQIRITDMIGKKVGMSFRSAAASLGIEIPGRITVVNDTVAASLCGAGLAGRGNYSGCLGFIYGTGTNLCYREPGREEGKAGEIINIESGAYCGFPTGDIDDLYDARMPDAGQDRFEKMVSGGYQGGLMEWVLRTAAREQLIQEETFRRISGVDSVSFGKQLTGAREASIDSRDISEFSHEPDGNGRIAQAAACVFDRRVLECLFDELTRRSACLCAISITGALLRSGAGRSSGFPAFITAEGSTFEKQKNFRRMLDAYMSALAGDAHCLSYEFHTIPDAVIRGTAIAAAAGKR